MIKASAHRVDITPSDSKGVFIAGFGFNRKARGVLDPIEAGILCLDDGNERVALVTLDLIGLHHNWIVKARASLEGSGIDPEKVLFCSTHNHAGPDTLGYWGPSILGVFPYKTGVDYNYLGFLEERVVEGVKNALKTMQPVDLYAKTFQTPPDLTRNDRKGGGKDDFGVVLQLRAADGG
ncbi:MAG: hypothetical protein FJ088_16115, partial [Deltaproteobacteria bacterium]|nr:hypothetical protein [Deltaproteobacteria bacterium]